MDESVFRLSPEEDWIFGVNVRGSTLSFGPSGSEVASSALACGLMIVMGFLLLTDDSSTQTINSYPVRNPVAMNVFSVLFVLAATAVLVSQLMAGVRADAAGLTIRTARRTRRLPWSDVAALRTHETAPHRWNVSVGPDTVRWQLRPVASWSVGVVELRDGTIVRLPGFRAAARSDGLSLGMPTVTEVKVGALARYMGHVTGRSVEVPTGAPTRIEDDDVPSPWTIVAYLGGAVSMWLLVSWAAGRLVSPVTLVIGTIFFLHQYSRQRRT